MSFKLGKKPAIRRMDVPAFGDFLDRQTAWPDVKPRGWEYALDPSKLGMLANDILGDCVIAAMMHYAQTETANTDNPLTPTEALAIETYSAITGYNPSDPSTDQGTIIQTQALPYWKNTGIPMLDKNGNKFLHKILGWTSLDLTSVPQQRYACDIFGGLILGINLPASAEQDTSNWTYHPKSKILGGHGVNIVGQGDAGWHLNSWGMVIPGTWEFSLNLADEIYAVVTPSWLDSQGKSPSGMDLDGLLNAMKAL